MIITGTLIFGVFFRQLSKHLFLNEFLLISETLREKNFPKILQMIPSAKHNSNYKNMWIMTTIPPICKLWQKSQFWKDTKTCEFTLARFDSYIRQILQTMQKRTKTLQCSNCSSKTMQLGFQSLEEKIICTRNAAKPHLLVSYFCQEMIFGLK